MDAPRRIVSLKHFFKFQAQLFAVADLDRAENILDAQLSKSDRVDVEVIDAAYSR